MNPIRLARRFLITSALTICLMFSGIGPVSYYYARNKVLAHRFSWIKPDDSINVGWFRWWPKAMELGIYLANPGGAIHLPPGYTETLSANLTLKAKTSLTCDGGTCIVTQGSFQVLLPAAANGASVSGPSVYGGQGSAQESNGFTFIYTGNSAAWDIGASGTNTFSFYLSKVHINIVGGGAAAIGLRITQVENYVIEYCSFNMGVSGQIGAQTNGGTGFVGTSTWNSDKWDVSGAINVTGIQFGGDGNQSNADAMVGENHFTLGGGATTSVGIDKKAGDTLILANASVDNALWGITVESTAAVPVWGFLRIDSTTTNIANFGAGSQGAMLFVNGNKPFTDSGVAGTNSIINPARFTWRTDVWQNQVQATFSFFFKDLLDSGNARLTLVNGAGGDTRLDPGSGGSGLVRTCVGVLCAGVSVESNGTRGILLDPAGRMTLKEAAAPSGSAGNGLIWEDSSDHMAKYNPNNGGEQHVPQIYMLTAQYTNSTTGFTTVGTPNIAFPVNANQKYTAECHLYYQAAATGGLNIQFTGPAAPTNVVYGLNDPISATTFGGDSVATAFSTSLGSAVTTAATNFDAQVSFSLANGANAGTVTLQAKSSAAVQLQIQVGSFCQVQ